MTKFKTLLMSAAVLASLTSVASASTIVLNEGTGWQYGQIANIPNAKKPGTFLQVLQDVSGSTVTAISADVDNPGGATFSLTDGFVAGDTYSIKIGTQTSLTGKPGINNYLPDLFNNNSGPYASFFAADWSSSSFAHLQVQLSMGDYTITVKDLSTNKDGSLKFGAPAGFGFRLDAVPEPASWAMMLVGLGGLGGALRARRKSVTA